MSIRLAMFSPFLSAWTWRESPMTQTIYIACGSTCCTTMGVRIRFSQTVIHNCESSYSRPQILALLRDSVATIVRVPIRKLHYHHCKWASYSTFLRLDSGYYYVPDPVPTIVQVPVLLTNSLRVRYYFHSFMSFRCNSNRLFSQPLGLRRHLVTSQAKTSRIDRVLNFLPD